MLRKDKIYYHVRSTDGVTLAWEDLRPLAEKRARENRALVFALNHTTGKAIRIA